MRRIVHIPEDLKVYQVSRNTAHDGLWFAFCTHLHLWREPIALQVPNGARREQHLTKPRLLRSQSYVTRAPRY
jgi:hypothetical protein